MSVSQEFGYTAGDLAFVVPTYNRPGKIVALLESLAAQDVRPGRIVVVGSGDSVEREVMGFADRLPVEYRHSERGGQIRQRNLGIDMLDEKSGLVGFLDDDLVLECGALAAMINFWHSVQPETAGVGFNVVNESAPTYSRLLGFFFMGSPDRGRILPSGFASSLVQVSESLRTQWLGGGYTVWRKAILDRYRQPAVDTRWAIGEDVRFSYPVGLEFPLYICAEARVRHEHVADQAPPAEIHRYRGRKWAVAHLVFVDSNDGLSLPACCWMLLGSVAMSLVAGIRGYGDARQAAMGKALGLWDFFRMKFAGRDHRTMLEDRA